MSPALEIRDGTAAARRARGAPAMRGRRRRSDRASPPSADTRHDLAGAEAPGPHASGLVVLVDDDESIRESLPEFLRWHGLEVEAFPSASAFLASAALAATACLVLDVAMPGMSGPELQQELARRGLNFPIVFITAHGDEPMRARVLRAGAAACLLKPFDEAELLAVVRTAIGRR